LRFSLRLGGLKFLTAKALRTQRCAKKSKLKSGIYFRNNPKYSAGWFPGQKLRLPLLKTEMRNFPQHSFCSKGWVEGGMQPFLKGATNKTLSLKPVIPHLAMIYKSILLLAFLLFSGLAQSQSLGFEFQAYPTGLIPGIRYANGWGERHEWNLRLGLNLIDHRDLGVKWDEQGWGYGGSLGYRYYFKPDWQGFFIGPRFDLWRNHIDWVDILPNDAQVSGVTRLLVVQPTAEAGYQWVFGS
jgi:hypothetical protein